MPRDASYGTPRMAKLSSRPAYSLLSSGDIRGASLGFLQRYEPWGKTDIASVLLGIIARWVSLSCLCVWSSNKLMHLLLRAD